MSSIVVPRQPGSVKPVALALISPALVRDLRLLTDEFGLHLELSNAPEIVAARIETSCPELVLVDSDLFGGVEDLFQFARSLRPDVWLIGVTCYWSERDKKLRTSANALVHKPPRGDEWRRAFSGSGLSSQVANARQSPVTSREPQGRR